MRLLADAVLLVHLAFVAFVIGGLLLIWTGAWIHWSWVRNFWFRVLHLSAIGFVALEALVGVVCPLTLLEDWLRPDLASADGFVQRWLHRLLFWDFAAWVFTVAYVCFALMVALTFLLFPPRRRRAFPRG